MAAPASTVLNLYKPDPEDPNNRWVKTAESLSAPRLCLLWDYCTGLLVDRNDPIIRNSFNDIVEDNWARVENHPLPLTALIRALDQQGRDMALTHRGIGPSNAMVFFNYDLINSLENASDDYTRDLLSFVCIVTILHEFRHWVRGVIKGMYDLSTKDELHLDWGKDANSRGESGYFGEHRLWGGVLVAGFGFGGLKGQIKFSTNAQSHYAWGDIKALGITKRRRRALQQLYVYTSGPARAYESRVYGTGP
ncbi:hypothetical protein AURDEDRAFT_119444 [Auricularia subglabra TFB-10046 SS5]|nr:hypothetical protein AURDEDRAFT_119444 [Auricularia subglabra TFB-10046 SS5]